jgi:hypothetical protein
MIPTVDQARSFAKDFRDSVGPDGFVSAEEGKRRLEQTGLPWEQLHRIWDLSDQDRDNRLSLREFVCALHLANQVSRGLPLPVEIHPEQQEALAHDVERHSGMSMKHRSRPEEWSTVDTAPTDAFQHSNGLKSRTKGFDLDGGGFDSLSGARSSCRGRDSSSRPLAQIDVGRDGVGGLDQLASVFEVVARLDPRGELQRLSAEVLQERRELEQQLSRRNGFERQLQESRSRIDTLREERRRAEAEAAANQRHIAHLQEEILYATKEVQEAEEDLTMLRESAGGALSRDVNRRGPAPYASPEEERRDVLSKVRAERELLHRDQRSIEELQAQIEEVFKQKQDAQLKQQSLLERQRQTEQDRGMMLTAIEAERSKLSQMRAERISMWEERCALEHEMTDLAQERWLAEHQPLPRREPAVRGPGVPSANGRSSPSSSEIDRRPRGVRQDDCAPPPVVAGCPPDGGLRSAADRYGFGSDIRNSRGSAGTTHSTTERRNPEYFGSRGGAISARGTPLRVTDGRGVRNEEAVSNGSAFGGNRSPFAENAAGELDGFGSNGFSGGCGRGHGFGVHGESSSALSAQSQHTATFG